MEVERERKIVVLPIMADSFAPVASFPEPDPNFHESTDPPRCLFTPLPPLRRTVACILAPPTIRCLARSEVWSLSFTSVADRCSLERRKVGGISEQRKRDLTLMTFCL